MKKDNILSLQRNAGAGVAMDNLTYHYKAGTNQLTYVDDAISGSAFSNDIDDQSSGNYTYDKIGNLISDAAEEIETIEWTVYGKIKNITRTTNSTKPSLSFEYSPDGHRVAKHVTDSADKTTSTWYVRDASGNILSTYNKEWVQPTITDTVEVMDIYDQLVLDYNYTSRLTFLDQKINWASSVPSTILDGLESDVVSNVLNAFLGEFSPVPYLTSSNTNLIFNSISSREIIDVLSIGGGIPDDDLYDIQFINNGLELLSDQITVDYTTFLQQLQAMQPMAYDDLCTALSLPPSSPPSSIIAASTPSNTASILYGLPYTMADMPIYKTLYDITVGLNSPPSWDFFGNLPNGKAVWMSHYGWNYIAQTITTFYGNTATWQKLFIAEPGTEANRVHDIRVAGEQVFLYVAIQKLNDPVEMRNVVDNLTGQTVDQWFLAIEQQYGTVYLNDLKDDVGYISTDPFWQYKLAENHIYGSSRIGLVERNLVLVQQVVNTDSLIYYSYLTDSIKTFYRGQKRYAVSAVTKWRRKLSNHLGNVLAVITDRRIQSCGAGDVMYYNAQVVSVSDYYPFGMGIKEREWKDSTFSYRFGFNGKEQDNSIKGQGNSYDFGARIYDSRLGRFLSVDPLFKEYTAWSSYVSFNDNPNYFKDPSGKNGIVTITKNDQGKNIMVISSNIVLYGGATDEQRLAIMSDMNKRLNGAETTTIDGVDVTTLSYQTGLYEGEEYEVQFDISVTIDNTITDENHDLISQNTDMANNFVRVTNAPYGPLTPSNTAQYKGAAKTAGSNSMNFEVKDIQANDGTSPHEFLHSLIGDIHPVPIPVNIPTPTPLSFNKGIPNMDPSKRALTGGETQQIINNIENVVPVFGPQQEGVTQSIGAIGELLNLYITEDMHYIDPSGSDVSTKLE